MSNPVPKEQLSAYQRWELSSFDAPDIKSSTPIKDTVVLPSQETVDLIKEDARRQGFEIGLNEGRQQGLSEASQIITKEVQQIRAILNSTSIATADIEDDLAKAVLALAIDMTKAVLKTSLALKPDLLLPLIKSSLREIPVLQKPAQIFLNPDDLRHVQTAIGEDLLREGWILRDEPSITKGGCRIETGSNMIDATVESRWSRITTSLGVIEGWLDE